MPGRITAKLCLTCVQTLAIELRSMITRERMRAADVEEEMRRSDGFLRDAIEFHVDLYGRVDVGALFGQLGWDLGTSWNLSQSDVVDEILEFVARALEQGDRKVRGAVEKRFIPRFADLEPMPVLEAFFSRWPAVLRDEEARQRAAGRSLLPGVRLEHSGGTAPIEVLWALPAEVEAMAVDDETVFVVGGTIRAVAIATGDLRWTYFLEDESGDFIGFPSSTGVHLSMLDGAMLEITSASLRLTLDAETGEQRSLETSSSGSLAPTGTPLPARPIRDLAIRSESGGSCLNLNTMNGETMGRLLIQSPSFDEVDPAQVGDVVLLPLVSGDLIALRIRIQ
jgi:hypothetical protein